MLPKSTSIEMDPSGGGDSRTAGISGSSSSSTKNKPKLVVIKRKRNTVGKNNNNKTKIRGTKKKTILSAGLPSFGNRPSSLGGVAAVVSASVAATSRQADDDDDELGDNSDDDEIPSEVLVAIHLVIRADHGLTIPLSNHITIQAVMEHQIYSTFDDNNATNIHRDLLELIHSTNQVRQLYCQQDQSTFAYVLTQDYVQAVWDAVETRQSQPQKVTDEIVSWFVTHLQYWTGRTVAQSSLERQWNNHCKEVENATAIEQVPNDDEATEIENNTNNKSLSFSSVLQLLLDWHLLIRDTQQCTLNSHQENHFYLWLPQWAIALKAWHDARKQLVAIIARAGKETSKMNLLRKNRHSYISTNFLLQDLIYRGKVTIIERPFGSFVKLVKDDGK